MWLFLYLIVLSIVAIILILYPLRQLKIKFQLLLFLTIVLAVSLGYWYWGGWHAWQEQLNVQKTKLKAQTILKKIKNFQELTQKMKLIAATDQSGRAWYLLGKLYAGKNEWPMAKDALAKAYQLQPQDSQIIISYATILWQLGEVNKFTIDLLKTALAQDGQQPDALAMLAMDAFNQHDYSAAISYWQRLLKLVPEQSAEARLLRKAIVKAEIAINNL